MRKKNLFKKKNELSIYEHEAHMKINISDLQTH